MQNQPATRVLVCDDSALIRNIISRTLESDPAIRVVARVADGQQALDALNRAPADVVVLDIEMPVMDGLTALPLILKRHPDTRVVMASTLTTQGADVTLRALRLGAADYIPKPGTLEALDADGFRRELLTKVKALSHRPKALAIKRFQLAPLPVPFRRPILLAIGSSTGGPQALTTLVRGLPGNLPVPVVITQHMPAGFTATLSQHLDRSGELRCGEARDAEGLCPGRIYLAPGDRHMLVIRRAGALQIALSGDPPVNFCRPSVDPMLNSAAEACAGRVLTVILTGMGQDGLAGTKCVTEAGGIAIAQDEATSVVWGMPGAVARAGLCHAVLPLSDIASRLLELISRGHH